MLRAQQACCDDAIEEGEQRIVETVYVPEHEGFGVKSELRPRGDFKRFVQGTEAAREGDEAIGEIGHERLALVHGIHHAQVLELQIGRFFFNEETRDDAGDFAAMGEDGIGKQAHETQMAATIDEPMAAAAEFGAKREGCLAEGEIETRVGPAVHANALPHFLQCILGTMITRRTLLAAGLQAGFRQTELAIDGEGFLINNKPTYAGREWRGHKVEGLLMNTRMVLGIFDDQNPETVGNWKYMDTQQWDADRNTREFVAAMPLWRAHGVLSFTLNMQGGNPRGYAPQQPWKTGAFTPRGEIMPAYLNRLRLILDRADELGMAPILGVFYFGQDQVLEDDRAIRRALKNTVQFVLSREYRNVMIEVANESNNRKYDHELLRPGLIPLLIRDAQATTFRGRRLLAGTSFNGNTLPTQEITQISDFVLLHGNGVKDPARIGEMARAVRKQQGYKPKPILFNEDDHFDFDKPMNHCVAAIGEYASWGLLDIEGYQSPPVHWGIDTDRKKGFFQLVKEITGT